MFQVIFPLDGRGVSEIEAVLPSGFTLEKTRFMNIYDVRAASNKIIGKLTYLALYKKVVIEVDESEPEGEEFWKALGRKDKVLDPFQVFFGVIYPAACACEGVYDLDVLPGDPRTSQDTLDALARIKRQQNAYFVKFLLGNWHAGKTVKVEEMEQILGKGVLGPKMKNWEFNLREVSKK